jgi:glycosyltransferase involved in cell wall biosynthesis
MANSGFVRKIAHQLEQFPRLYRFLTKLYGLRGFNLKKISYKNHYAITKSIKIEPKKYKIIFDGQCFQTLTRQRGIGKYSLSLISAICRERFDQKFAVILTNIASEEDIEFGKNAIENLNLTNLEILVVDLFKDRKMISFAQAEKEIQSFVQEINAEIFLTLSEFENPRHTIKILNIPNSLNFGILYDLIPLQFKDDFLNSKLQREKYDWQLSTLRNRDGLLSISETSRTSWINLVGDETAMQVIYGGGYNVSALTYPDFESRRGVLCIGAESKHKNIERLILAYSKLDQVTREDHPLTIIGIRSQGSRSRFLRLSKRLRIDVVIPNYVSQEELTARYQSSRLLVMPSLAEGLSLPILEAWSCGLPCIGSQGTVAEELILEDDLLFMADKELEIYECMNRFLTSKGEWMRAFDVSMTRYKSFDWSLTAQKALIFMEDEVNG